MRGRASSTSALSQRDALMIPVAVKYTRRESDPQKGSAMDLVHLR